MVVKILIYFYDVVWHLRLFPRLFSLFLLMYEGTFRSGCGFSADANATAREKYWYPVPFLKHNARLQVHNRGLRQ